MSVVVRGRARLAVVTAGHVAASSTTRLGLLLGDAARDRLAETGVDAEITHVELRRTAMDVARALVEGVQSEAVGDALSAVATADALIIVTPTINASFSGLLKSFLDLLPPDALRSVPTAIAATGGSQRHTLVLDQAVRPMLGYLRAIVLPQCLFVTADEWDGPRPIPALAGRIDAAAAELAAFTPVAHRG